MNYLRQSTAATVAFGPFISTDGVTELASLTSQAGRITKGGTASAFTASSWSHDADANYLVGLSATDTGTVGRLRVSFQDSATYLPVWMEFQVLSAAVYDWLFGPVAPPTLAQIVGGVWDEPQSGHTTAGTFGAYLDASVSGVSTGGVSASAVASAVWQDLTAGADFATVGSVGAMVKANLDAKVSDRLASAAYTAPDHTTLGYLAGLLTADHSAFTATALANAPAGSGTGGTGDATKANQTTILAALTAIQGTGFDTAADSLHVLRGQGDSAWKTATSVTVSDKTGFALVAGYDAAKSAASQASVDEVVAQTDQLAFDGSGNVLSAPQALKAGIITSASFTVGALAGVASGLLEKIDALWRVFYKASLKDNTGGQIRYLADDGATPLATVAYTDDGAGNQTRGAAS